MSAIHTLSPWPVHRADLRPQYQGTQVCSSPVTNYSYLQLWDACSVTKMQVVFLESNNRCVPEEKYGKKSCFSSMITRGAVVASSL
jgi:hypothetical protein